MPARIVSALRLAYEASTGPQSAAEITRLVTERGGVRLAGTNVARFLRDPDNKADLYLLRYDRQRYVVSSRGCCVSRKHLGVDVQLVEQVAKVFVGVGPAQRAVEREGQQRGVASRVLL
jgi:hypothetical protein